MVSNFQFLAKALRFPATAPTLLALSLWLVNYTIAYLPRPSQGLMIRIRIMHRTTHRMRMLWSRLRPFTPQQCRSSYPWKFPPRSPP